ncbi:CheY chemotaxis protein or a CheY-like REC (receiver) domain [Aromatoleum tolulyticum]|uniref:CheY chemotaxis protein or a CheY-like REC (Receiver) domain n=1 Tax=Aromatoleum tolulyticum TaxID=34027 RepID=A0A1N6W656_9RHOO|nr:response regulator [Aromatoleum tolulyticum]SIQ85607.1 CheY chemotaxis protein or a CheY-like REC (receiver) domain [Aromatoleum tolulyticum]
MTGEHGGRSILLVEDNPVDLDLALRAFARRGPDRRIEVARDGEEALAYLRRWEQGHPPPALVLLDIKLPRVNGLEVLRQLKSHPRFGCLPVVMLTTSGEDADVGQAYELGANSYIIKPVNFARFIEVTEQIEQYWCLLNALPS